MSEKNKTNWFWGCFAVSFILIAVFYFMPGDAKAVDDWMFSCSLTGGDACGLGRQEGTGGYFDSEGWHTNSHDSWLGFHPQDFGVSQFSTSEGYLNIEVKGMNMRDWTVRNSITGFQLFPWSDCRDNWSFYVSLRPECILVPNDPAQGGCVWMQDIGYFPPQNFQWFQWDRMWDDGWYQMEFQWDNSTWGGELYKDGTLLDVGGGAKEEDSRIVNMAEEEDFMVYVGGMGESIWDESGGADVTFRNLEFAFIDGPLGNPNAADSCACPDPDWTAEQEAICNGEEPEDPSDDPDNPYDTCSCHGIPDVNEIPCEDQLAPEEDKEKISFIDAAFPFKFIDVSMKWLWDLTDIIDEGATSEEEVAPLPDMAIELAPPSPKQGEQTTSLAAAMNFRTRMQNIYFGWCLVKDNVTYSMNNFVAGGQKFVEPTTPDLTWSEKGCCQPITRTPAPGDDTDNDGMSDAWEELMFVGRQFGEDSEILYNDISEVLPGDDPDADGYYANTFKNEEGQILTVTPYMIDSLGNVYATGTSAGKLTNVQEYILDTDPLNGDTDGDGYKDEMDFIGVGQMQMEFLPEKAAGPDGFYDVSVAAVGINQAKKTSIDSAYQRIFIGNEGNLQIELIPSSETITFDDNNPTTIQAAIVSSTANVNNILFEWSFNGEPACDGVEPDFPDLCDPDQLGKVGKDTITIGEGGISFLELPEPTSENYDISVIATDLGTRAQDRASISLPYALGTSLVTEGCAGQTEDITTLSANNPDPVIVCISESDDFTGTDPSDLNYVWTKDGHVDNEQSGLGRNEYALVPTKPAGEDHVLGVSVRIASTSDELVNAQQIFDIAGPSVEIVSPESRPCDPVNIEGCSFSSVNAGDEVQLVAEIKNFGDVNKEVTWLAQGNQIFQEETEGDQSSTSLTIPESATDGDAFGVSVQVSSLDRTNPEQSSVSLSLVVGGLPAELGAANPLMENLAAVFTRVPKVFQGLIIYAAIAAAIFFALVFVYPKIGRAWTKSLPLYKTWQGKYRSDRKDLAKEKRLAQKLRHSRKSNI